jgi:hypothetical protein
MLMTGKGPGANTSTDADDVEVPMRQIHPRSSYSPVLPLPNPVPRAVPPEAAPIGITVDLRDVRESRHPSHSQEQRLRAQLTEVRRAMEVVMEQLSDLVDQRESLKARLGMLTADAGIALGADDRSVVAWGFFDDDL